MAVAALADVEPGLERVAALLGGKATFGRSFSTALEAHEVIEQGFPAKSLAAFVSKFPTIGREDTIDKVVGVSKRTLQRGKAGGKDRLTREQSGRLYKAAGIMAKALDVFGSPAEAVRFMEEPAMALDRKRPIDLIATPAGADLVERHLTRLDYGVYT